MALTIAALNRSVGVQLTAADYNRIYSIAFGSEGGVPLSAALRSALEQRQPSNDAQNELISILN